MLHDYQDLFPTKFTEMKGIVRDLGVMRIPLKEQRLAQLLALEEERFIAGFHQKVQKA